MMMTSGYLSPEAGVTGNSDRGWGGCEPPAPVSIRQKSTGLGFLSGCIARPTGVGVAYCALHALLGSAAEASVSEP